MTCSLSFIFSNIDSQYHLYKCEFIKRYSTGSIIEKKHKKIHFSLSLTQDHINSLLLDLMTPPRPSIIIMYFYVVMSNLSNFTFSGFLRLVPVVNHWFIPPHIVNDCYIPRMSHSLQTLKQQWVRGPALLSSGQARKRMRSYSTSAWPPGTALLDLILRD